MKNLTNNLPQKLISLFLSIILWIFIMDTEDPTINKTIKNIKIDFKNENTLLARDLDLINSTEQFFDITLTGRRSELLNVQYDNFYAYVDLKNADVDSNKLEIKIQYPSKYKISSQSKYDINVDIDKISNKKFKPLIQISNLNNPDIKADVINENFKEIEISAPNRILEKIKNIIFDVNLENILDSSIVYPNITIIDENNLKNEEREKIKILNENINLYVKLTKYIKHDINYITEGKLNENIEIKSIDISPKSLILSAEPKYLQNIKDFRPFVINLDNIKNSFSEIYNIDLPDYINIESLPVLKVEIIKNIEKNIIFNNKDNLILNNLDKDLNIDILSNNSLTFYGDENLINNISPKLELNLANLIEGEYDIQANIINLDESIKIFDENNNPIINNKIKDLKIRIYKN